MAKQPRILAGETAAITGAARGIGRATAEALLRQGMRVAIGDVDTRCRARDRRGARPARRRAAARRDRPRHRSRRFLDGAEEQLGPLDVLVNNAGIMQVGRFIDEDDLTARRMVDINIHGVILGIKLALERMIPRDRGHIVNISSAGGQVRRARRRDLLGDEARRRRPDRGGPRRAAPDGRPHRRQLRDAVRRQHRARLRARRGARHAEPRAERRRRRDRRGAARTASSTCGCRSRRNARRMLGDAAAAPARRGRVSAR